jgi:RHS repeat-associated protein
VDNTVAITDSFGTVVNSYNYSPFRMILTESETFAQPFKFVGKLGMMAEANGFYYMRARYYDPVVGRFISEDPLGFDGGDVNLYVYAGLNPLLVVDPWGLFDIQDSTRNVIDRLGGEQMLINGRNASLIVTYATSESGVGAMVFGSMAAGFE